MAQVTPEQLVTWLVAGLGGGLAGSIVTAIISGIRSRRSSNARERAVIAALASELRAAQLICAHNAQYSSATNFFARFPVAVATHVTFEERYSYPSLAGLLEKLETYVLALVRMNDTIDLHHDSVTRRGNRDLQDFVFLICKGSSLLVGIGPDNKVDLPHLIDAVHSGVIGLLERKKIK